MTLPGVPPHVCERAATRSHNMLLGASAATHRLCVLVGEDQSSFAYSSHSWTNARDVARPQLLSLGSGTAFLDNVTGRVGLVPFEYHQTWVICTFFFSRSGPPPPHGRLSMPLSPFRSHSSAQRTLP